MIQLTVRAISVTFIIACGVAFTWTCALVGFWNLSPGGCHISNEKLARRRVDEVSTAITEFTLVRDRCPRTQEELSATNHTSGPFLDPWGTSLVFTCSWRAIIVTSAGADRLFNTDDDVHAVQTFDAGRVSNPETEPCAPS